MQKIVVSTRVDEKKYRELLDYCEKNEIKLSDYLRNNLDTKEKIIIPKARRNVAAKRHLLKTISYRIISSGFGFLILWQTTGDPKIGAAFTTAELLYKPFLYFIHERLWYRFIKYGIK